MSKKLKESVRMMAHYIKNINKEIEIINKNQMKILELKSIITEMKIRFRGSTEDLG